MKLPRDVGGERLVRVLRRRLGYVVIRQTGSHLRIQTDRNGVHKQTVPRHNPLKVGTLHELLSDIAAHHGMSVEDLVKHLRL